MPVRTATLSPVRSPGRAWSDRKPHAAFRLCGAGLIRSRFLRSGPHHTATGGLGVVHPEDNSLVLSWWPVDLRICAATSSTTGAHLGRSSDSVQASLTKAHQDQAHLRH